MVEVVTKPDMLTPHEAAEVDGLLGRLLRASGRVRRGIGTVRQDVNVSINGSDRVEIKGVPRTPDIRALTHYEALRHKALLELKDELRKRGITTEDFKAEDHEVTDLLSNTSNPRLRALIDKGEVIHAVNLKGWRELVRYETQPALTFADELAGRVRVIACLDEMPNIFVLDGRGEGLAVEAEEHLRKAVGAGEADALVLVWGPTEDALTGAQEIAIRTKEATVGVPQESRQHMPDACRTDFERILPGPDRMYPDTDSPPVAISKERVARIQAITAPRPWEREERYKKLGIPEHLARNLAIHPNAGLFDRLADDTSLNPTLLAEALVQWQKAIKRDKRKVGLNINPPYEKSLESFFKTAADRETPRRALYYAFEKLLYGEDAEPPSPLPEDELKALCQVVVTEFKNVRYKTRELTLNFLVGEAIEQSEGRAEPAKTRFLLSSYP